MIPVKKKGKTPAFLKKYQGDPSLHYSDLSGVDKQNLKELLVDEQDGLCVYCMGRIRPNYGHMKIEHYHPQSKYPEEELDYRNMFGVCMGQIGNPGNLRTSDLTCDARKGNSELHLFPSDQKLDQLLTYKRNGLILPAKTLSSTRKIEIENDLNDTLNLNHKRLMADRKEVLDTYIGELQRKFGSKKIPLSFWEKEEESYRSGSRKGQIYKGILLDYIVKKIHQSR